MVDLQTIILDDDPAIRELIEDAARSEGLVARGCGTVKELYSTESLDSVHLFMLDITLPDGSGLDVAKYLRREFPGAGIIMITGHMDEMDTVLALEFGADDYVTKPFRGRELRARIKSVLRRLAVEPEAQAQPSDTNPKSVMVLPGFRINTAARSVKTEQDKEVSLTTLEYDVLLTLTSSPNRVLTREQIMDSVRGQDWAAYDRAIDGLVSRLRSKLQMGESSGSMIKTIRGVGYMFAIDE